MAWAACVVKGPLHRIDDDLSLAAFVKAGLKLLALRLRAEDELDEIDKRSGVAQW